eukprot:TRINITY_DN7489_c0_g1_i2.p1 TRINITY_DN7489_c0_g1~~TRINITY_DN7489_c0_g1_i2.p1  ORF type:complete len:287 (-),score=57.15 TRINITY_DN7489_c0_g1_i2:4-864(-)
MLMKRKLQVLRGLEEQMSSDEESFSSLSDVPRERGFENLSPGYTTEDSNIEDQNDQQLEISIPTPPPERPRQKRRPPEEGGSKRNDPEGKEGKGTKGQKNVLTIKPATKESIESYRAQERARYAQPHKPWTYKLADERTAIVAPVLKKMPTSNIKPRDHFMLKNDRPGYITILCLVRDAASRLPNGVGTRADICELLKESQYINENVSDEKVSNIVSGALDRLHYEDDACVQYDQEKKLWTYLHKDRTEEYPAWIDQGDPRSSKKKEYNEKYKKKKRVNTDDSSYA